MSQQEEPEVYAPYPILRPRLDAAKAWKSELIALLHQLWEHGVDRIQEPGLRMLVDEFLRERVPIAFYLEPASPSGKHHPAWQNREHGTLLSIIESCVLIPPMAVAIPELVDRDRRPADAWTEFAVPRRRTLPEIVERVAQASVWHYGIFSPGWTEGMTFTPETKLVHIVDLATSLKELELVYASRLR